MSSGEGMVAVEDLRKWTEHGILADYIVVGASPRAGAIIHRESDPEFRRGVTAATIANQLGISLAYAQSRYVKSKPSNDLPPTYAVFQRSYLAAMNHIETTLERFQAEGRPDPTAGVLYSDATLERLPATFYAAGLLYRLGYLFEAQAVARVILEQVAWAYAVRSAEDFQYAMATSVTGSITTLKHLLPSVGKLYGALSADTHLGLEKHMRFLDVSGGLVSVKHTHGIESWRAGLVLLDLADCWSVVYESTQEGYMTSFENWTGQAGELHLRLDRPFLEVSRTLKAEMEIAWKTARDTPASDP